MSKLRAGENIQKIGVAAKGDVEDGGGEQRARIAKTVWTTIILLSAAVCFYFVYIYGKLEDNPKKIEPKFNSRIAAFEDEISFQTAGTKFAKTPLLESESLFSFDWQAEQITMNTQWKGVEGVLNFFRAAQIVNDKTHKCKIEVYVLVPYKDKQKIKFVDFGNQEKGAVICRKDDKTGLAQVADKTVNVSGFVYKLGPSDIFEKNIRPNLTDADVKYDDAIKKIIIPCEGQLQIELRVDKVYTVLVFGFLEGSDNLKFRFVTLRNVDVVNGHKMLENGACPLFQFLVAKLQSCQGADKPGAK